GHLTVWRPFVVFGFGLLHGLGFAGVLGEVGLPASEFITGLISFNLGVELGQLTVILVCFLVVGFWFGSKPFYRKLVVVPVSTIVGLIGLFWFVERIVTA
ncbi:MAG: HupE/UreJ family protein, partial [Hyphomicrobiaceae bacterium]|nr:HupE/UreJ family protein [Hyphomicrobiaceae bacterium]